MAEQMGLDLPSVPALGRADFLVAPSNALALAMIESWENWTPRKLLLVGPAGSGKTHLTHVWATLAVADVIAASALTEDDVPTLAARSVAVEDVHLIADNTTAQAALFHLHNLVLAEGHSLLMTGTGAPTRWDIALPDLASRLNGTQIAQMEAPDDALLSAVLAKLFADRQLAVKPDLIAYLVRRMDRSFAAAREIVARLDAASLAQKRPISRQLAGRLLDDGGAPG